MTITEFLLARIAEDEQVARWALDERRLVGARVEGPDFGFYASSDCGDAMVHAGVERVLAECAAKRRIAERFPSDGDPGGDGYNFGIGYAIEALAAVYADHDDYDQAWAL